MIPVNPLAALPIADSDLLNVGGGISKAEPQAMLDRVQASVKQK